MKIRPVILCGGSGTRLWPKSKKHQAKQFIDFGGWTLLGKTLERIKGSLFDTPIISTNSKYLKEIQKHLKKYNIKKYKIVLEPTKKKHRTSYSCYRTFKGYSNETAYDIFNCRSLDRKSEQIQY